MSTWDIKQKCMSARYLKQKFIYYLLLYGGELPETALNWTTKYFRNFTILVLLIFIQNLNLK